MPQHENMDLLNFTVTCNDVGLLLLALMVAMIHAHYALIATKIGMMARIMTTGAVYHKVGM